ncbi:alanyl-tRNA editing protein [Neobacillus notoginsengisoli]|uniref:Alanyl-tRNA editing protein n=1 Tax=Neobacillus notoginsengisoli TaxID=1578198 RepID=A0A417YWV3_9BACI|nr:DHHA1 domain-containing protein [Neobacillus notoginsengisoli]RHW42077.1 alanyl-tRNA editing protein [Neobacillus notoginsengisoli]
MSEKLFYQNPYLTKFTSSLVKQEQDERGNWIAVLRETAFYPTGGGQPHDTGTLNGVKVIGVEEEDGEVRHFLDERIEGAEISIHGEIDWDRRFDHMQQHTGQHILSAAFDNLFGYKTVGFHLGREESTIDLETTGLEESQILEAEKIANRIVLENRPIETRWVTKEEATLLPLRKQLSVNEDIRLVIIPDFDYNGCGGTHPSSTGQAGLIKVLGTEKEKKKTRVTFTAGERSFEQFSKKQQVVAKLTPLLNAPQEGLEKAVLRLLEAKEQLEKQLEEVKDTLIEFEAKELRAKSKKDEYTVAAVFKERPIQEMQKLARLVVNDEIESRVIFVSETDRKLQIVCAKGKVAEGNMKELLGKTLLKINGRGGGSEFFAQGGGEAVVGGQKLLEEMFENI